MGKRDVSFPVIAMAGYANSPADYDASAGVFEDFVRRVAFGAAPGRTHFELQKSAVPAPTPVVHD
jgi:hypothetical protein